MGLIHITTHDGKMEGVPSISTSVLLNKNCEKNSHILGSICSHCYAHSLCEQRSGLATALARNTEILTASVLSDGDLPETSDSEIFRFESFGDLNNDTQLINYMNIVAKNPGTRFTLYTKQYELVKEYFTTHPAPENFTLIVSSLMVNKEIDIKFLLDLGVFAPGQLKTFTVYNKKYLLEHPEVKINCGSNLCLGCRLCYDKNEEVHIREILKTDQSSILKMVNWNDPAYREDLAAQITDVDLDDLF